MPKSLKLLSDLLPFVWVKSSKIRFQIIFSILLMLSTAGINLCVPMALKKAIDQFSDSTQHFENKIMLPVLAYGLLWLMGQITLHLRGVIFSKVLAHSFRKLALNLFNHLMTLSLRFHLNKKTGEILSSMDRAHDALPKLLDGLFIQIIPIVIEVIVAFTVVLQLYGIQYSLILLLTIFLYLISTLFTVKQSVITYTKSHEKHSQLSSYLVDTLLNYEAVKCFNNESFENKNCDHILKEKEEVSAWMYARMGYIAIGQMLVVGIGLISITLQAAYGIQSGKLSTGDFILLNGYLLQFSLPMSYFGYVVQGVRQSFSSLELVFNLLNIQADIQDTPAAKSLNPNTWEIQFKDVSFSYENKTHILNRVSFKVPAGKSVAIVGETGSGKSTLVKLLFRFFDLNAGHIFIGGQNIREVSQSSLRNILGLIPQDTILFNRSLYENIAYGNPSAPQEEIEEAIRLAHLDSVIQKLPQGYHTIVGERGSKLSGGERQRVAIARAILKRPKIYIFDEATSSLDVKTEQMIQKNLEEISAGSTTLIIAHRLSTVMHAHEILVLDAGQIAEKGTHDSLLKTQGIYADLWAKQSKAELPEGILRDSPF